MKKLFLTIGFLLISIAFAEERVLLSPTSKASLGDDIAYAENFVIGSQSGHFNSDNLKILPANESGFRVCATDVPRNESTHYEIYPAYPSFLNVDENGNEVEASGVIGNATDIKQIKVVASFNRPYDELFLLYSTSPTGDIKVVKFKPENDVLETMTEATLIFDNAAYNDNVKTRVIKADPALGGNSTGIYFRGFKVQTNAPYGIHVYSPYSIVYIKEVTITYDLRFTKEQWDLRQQLKKEWNIDDGSEATKQKAINDITYRKKLESIEKEKMHEN